MADYNQNIKVTADTKQAEKELSKLDQALKGLSKFTLDIGKGAATTGVKLAQRNLQDYGRTLGAIDRQLGGFGKRLGDIAKAFDFGGKTVVGIAGINALGSAMSGLPRIFGPAASALRGFGGAVEGLTSPIQAVTAAIQALGPGGLAAAGGIAAATAAFMAFSPAVKKVVTGLDNLVLGGKIQSAFGGIKGKVEETKQSFFGLNTTIEATVQGLNELAGGMSLRQLNTQVSSLTKEMESYHSSTVEAWTAAQQLVTAKKAEVAEQKALNDLVRQAKGLRSESVEARATNTYNVTQRRNSFLKEQADDAERLQRALGAMGSQGSNPFGMSQDQIQGGALAKYTSDMERLQEVLGKMETRGASNPFGITAKQIETADHNTKKWKSDLEQVNAELADLVSLHKALGQMEGKGSNPFGIEQDQIQEAYQMRFKEEKAYEDLRGDTIRHALQMELDSIDEVFNARTKANAAALKDFDKRLEQRTSKSGGAGKGKGGFDFANAAVSGAFPLLFGAGPGAILGGFGGGGISGMAGNPMFGIVTSAIGQMVDQFAAAAIDMGKALRDPITNFQKIKDASLLASKSQEYYVQRLIEVGRITEAAAVVQQRVVELVGRRGANDMTAAGAAADRLSKAWAELNLQMQAAISGPLANLLEWITSVVRVFGESGKAGAQVKDLLSGLSPTQQAAFQREMLQNNQRYGTSPKALQEEARIMEKYRSQAKPVALTPAAISPEAQDQARKAAEAQADAIKSAYREGFQLQRQAADIAMAAADYRRKIESDIFAKNQEAARLEIDNARKSAQLRIESSDLALRKQFSGSQGLTEELLNGVRAYLSARRTGEADIAQKRRQLEVNLADINKATADYIYEQAKSRLQLERQIEDYKMNVADYQLKVARQVQEQNIVSAAGATSGAAAAGGRLGQPIEYLTGDRAHSGYRADHGGGNYHEHIAYRTAQEARAAAELLNRNGIKTTELKGVNPVGGHSRNSYHYSGQAFDVPAAQVPVGQEQELSRRVRRILGIGGQGAVAPQLQRATTQVPRPGFSAPEANTSGFTAAQSRLAAAKQKEVELEEKLQKLNIDKAAFDLQESAAGKSQVEALTQQRNLEVEKLRVMTLSGNLSENEVERILKQREGEAQINAIFQARNQIVKQLNDAVKAGKLTQDEANAVLKEINHGIETRLNNTRTQIALEQELLSIQQAQKLALEAQSMQRQLMSTGQGINAGYTGSAAGTYDRIYGETGDRGLAGNFAGAQSVLDQAQMAQSDAQGLGGTIAGGFKEALKAAVTGGDLKQAFASMLSDIGGRLLDIAFRPLEDALSKAIYGMLGPSQQQIQAATMMLTAAQQQLAAAQMMAAGGAGGAGGFSPLGILGSVFSVAGGAFGGGAFGSGFNPLSTTKLFSGGIFEGGGYTGNAPRAGGMDGKGGFPAILHPGETVTDHRSSAARSALNGGGSGGGAPSMTLNVTATQIADDRWVKVDDLDAAMSKAARQGAAMGERRTLDRLRQSPNTRRQLGI